MTKPRGAATARAVMRFPCAGCGKKCAAETLRPVMHYDASGHWLHMDKRCVGCKARLTRMEKGEG